MALTKDMDVCEAPGGLLEGPPGGRPLPTRKRLDHRGPVSIDVSAAWYFITICAAGHRPWVHQAPRTSPVGGDHRAPRTSPVGGDHRAPRTFDEIATMILDEGRFFHNAGKWFLSLMLVMPDHLHFIVHGPPGGRPLPLVIGDFKRYLTSHCAIDFQKDFWDTRLRTEALYAEKFRYICDNPVRKGLCAVARDWAHVIAFNRETGEELARRGPMKKGADEGLL